MSTKVEICGVNTAKLPKLKHKEMLELIKKAQGGCTIAKDEFLMANLRLVLSIVQRFYGKKELADDLFQVGCIGLIKSMQNFNTELNLRFSTYAVPMVLGEIRRFLRDSSSVRVSRSVRDKAYIILQERQKLEKDASEEVSLEMVASSLEMPIKEVAYCMDAISNPVYLFDPVYTDGGESVMLMDKLFDSKNTEENYITSVSIDEAMGKLTNREREILLKRFYEGKTQIEVSDEIGISQAQVSRLEKNAISVLKANIEV